MKMNNNSSNSSSNNKIDLESQDLYMNNNG